MPLWFAPIYWIMAFMGWLLWITVVAFFFACVLVVVLAIAGIELAFNHEEGDPSFGELFQRYRPPWLRL
jgi:predicted small integral membrane protein